MRNYLDLQEKVALITGAAQGIGRATALLLAAHGARVAVTDILAEKGQAVVAEIRAAGGIAEFIYTDVSQHAQIEAAVSQTVGHWGRLDIVVNNAYWSQHGSVIELAEADWDKSMAVMLKAIYLFGKYAFPVMINQGGGVMVNIASVHGEAVHPRYPVYAAAKAGVLNLTRQMALDFGPHHIRVNAICPGWIVTEHVSVPAEVLHRAAQVYPLRRTGVPEDIANTVLFLVSELASFVTGHALYADGGLTVQLQDAVAAG